VEGDDRARYEAALLDWLACAVAGGSEPPARAAAAAGDGLLDRVAATGTAGHALDFDDTYLPGIAHLSAPTAPAALVLGAVLEVSIADALTAYAAGFEAAGAMSRAAHPALYDGGWHPTAVCGALGAAVTSARLLELDREAERSAAALALLRAAGLRSAFGTAGKSIQVGMAAAAGVAAAQIAAGGGRLDLDRVASGPGGFEEAFGAAFALDGDELAIEENWIKAYPCCLQTHGAIESGLGLRETGAVNREAKIEVTVHPVSLQAAPVNEPADGLEAKFSIPYLTAFALLHGPPRIDSFDSVDAAAAELAANVSVTADTSLLESEARLAINGEEAFRIEAALGSPQRPMDAAARAKKRAGLAGERLEGLLEAPQRPVAELLAALEV
jgi:2-methylcitrate dehydratase PrpD